MLDTATYALLLAGMTALSFATRGVFLIPGDRLRPPPLLRRALRYAPAAALAAIVAPDMLLQGGEIQLAASNPRLVGGAAALVVAVTTRNILATIAAGMFALTAVRLLA